MPAKRATATQTRRTRPTTRSSKATAGKGNGRGTRGPLKAMHSSDAFRAFIAEQLAGLREFHSRAMFGGVGLYASDVFFGIIAADALYLKVDDSTRAAYEEAGSEPLRPYADKPMVMPYFNVPLSVLEDAPTLLEWAKQAVAVARAAKARKR